jgi:hypothetical protein
MDAEDIPPDLDPEEEQHRSEEEAAIAGPAAPHEIWEYRNILHKTDRSYSWREMSNSYYHACLALVEGLVIGNLKEDREGPVAVYLFRHYLELMLKRIVFGGRLLASESELAIEAEIKEVKKTHNLKQLWEWVLRDAKPKIDAWSGYDIAFVEACVMEFYAADEGSFVFRYDKEGAENYRFDFEMLGLQIEHIHNVLDGLWTYLYVTRDQILEYMSELESEYGGSYF